MYINWMGLDGMGWYIGWDWMSWAGMVYWIGWQMSSSSTG